MADGFSRMVMIIGRSIRRARRRNRNRIRKELMSS